MWNSLWRKHSALVFLGITDRKMHPTVNSGGVGWLLPLRFVFGGSQYRAFTNHFLQSLDYTSWTMDFIQRAQYIQQESLQMTT